MKKTMKKQTKKPAARTATKPTGVPVSKTVARPLVPAVPPPPDPEEARINREASAAVIEGRRHMRLAEQYRLKSGTPYTGKDERLVGSTFHDREALRVWGGLAEEEEAAAERCVEELRRAQGELKDLRDRKAQQDYTAALREHAAALRASNTQPTSSSPDDAAERPANIVQEEAVRAWWIETPERPRGNKKRLDAFRVWVDGKWMPRTDFNRIRRTIRPDFFAALCERFRKTPPTA